MDAVDRHALLETADRAVDIHPEGVRMIAEAIAQADIEKVLGICDNGFFRDDGARVEGKGHTVADILEAHVAILRVRKQRPVLPVPAAVVQHGVVHAGGVFRMSLQKIHLPLELHGIRPVIVPFAQGDILAARLGIQHLQTQILPLGIEIHGLIKGTDQLGIFCGVFAHDLRRRVGRGVVVDENLNGEVHLLHEKALQRVAEVILMIIGQTAD